MTKTLPQNSTKCDFVNVSVVIKSFFLDYRHLTSCHFNFAIFFLDHREISCNKVVLIYLPEET